MKSLNIILLSMLILLAWTIPSLADKPVAPPPPLPEGLSRDTQFIIYYIDKRNQELREDMNTRFEQVDKRFEQVDRRIQELRDDMNIRFEQVDKRFEQVDKRFEQVDKQFEQMMNFLWIITSIFTALVAAVIAFALWDRRTMLSKAKEEIEREGSLKNLILALRKLAEKDGELAEVLRSFSLL